MSLTGDEGSETDSEANSSPAEAGASDDYEEPRDHVSTDEDVDLRDQDDLEDEDEDEGESEDDDRENRFTGPSSTWRHFTADERALEASLDQERANDLSIHLYNAHALKARVRDPEASFKVKAYHGKKRWIKRNEDGTLPWYPEARWTAWPLEPQNVPRKEERFGVDLFDLGADRVTYRMNEPWKPSADLEDEIHALILRKAKERFRERQVAQSSEHQTKTGPTNRVETTNPVLDVKRETNDAAGEQQSGANDDQDNPESSDSSGGGFGVLHMLTDDDEAASILQPTVRHIISQLDDLLSGLSKSRQGHEPRINQKSRPRSMSGQPRTQSPRKDSAGKHRPLRRNVASSKDAQANGSTEANETVSHKRQAFDDEYIDTSSAPGKHSPGEDTSEGIVSGDTGTNLVDDKKPKRQRPLNPRDWSEVIGMASLVGWDPAIVERAARRCSSLFGENMQFNASALSDAGTSISDNTLPTNGQRMPHSSPHWMNDFLVNEGDGKNRCLSCPLPECQRQGEPFEKAWRWREHMKRSHKYSKAEIEKLEASLKSNLDGSTAPGIDPEIEDKGPEIDAADEQSQGRYAGAQDEMGVGRKKKKASGAGRKLKRRRASHKSEEDADM